MNIFRKFEFLPSDWEAKKKLIQLSGTTPQGEAYSYWNPDLIVLVYEVGHICTEWGKDKEGNQTCVKQSEKVAVDIVWKDEVLPAFVPYLVWPKPPGVSSMGYALDTEYAKAYCVANPAAEYCQPPKPIKL
jgi:hypothetical protein